MISNGVKGTDIVISVQAAGYVGSPGNVRHYISDWKKRRKQLYDGGNETDVKTQIIERNDAFRLLFHALEKVECISPDIFGKICSIYPCFQKVHDIVWDFRQLLTAKTPDELASWLKKAKDFKIREINSFVDGVKRDYVAVFNAIKFDYSNGLAEGKVNEL